MGAGFADADVPDAGAATAGMAGVGFVPGPLDGPSKLPLRYSATMTRTTLTVLEIVIGIGALAGGVNALAGAKGVPREWLHHTPFKTYLVPGLVLIAVIGGSTLASAGLLIAGAAAARLVSLEAGIALLGWMAAQLVTIGYRHWLQPLLVVLGLAVVVLSLKLPCPG
jgi:hypothetical protein